MKVKIIQDTICGGIRLTTFQLLVPRIILPQILTHRQFSRNVQSNRAFPTKKLVDKVSADYYTPSSWGSNKAGMQPGEEIPNAQPAVDIWDLACTNALIQATCLDELGVHKQYVNRLLEPFQKVHMIISATDYGNFFKLRAHSDAQHEINELACLMQGEIRDSKPTASDEHLPYVTPAEYRQLKPRERYLVSSARCARVSYANHEGTVDVQKDLALANRLIEAGHWSPFEHCASFYDVHPGRIYYGNFRSWRSFRNRLQKGPVLKQIE